MAEIITCPCSLKIFKNYKTHRKSASHTEFMQYGYHWKIPIQDGHAFGEDSKYGYFTVDVYSDMKQCDKLWFMDNTGLVHGVATYQSSDHERINYDNLFWIKHIDMKLTPIKEITLHTCSDIVHIKRRPIKGLSYEYTNILTYLSS